MAVQTLFASNDVVSYEVVSAKAPFDMPAIKVPVFPDRDFVVTEFGAVEGAKADISAAISNAIAACTAAGGGRVVIPPGKWLTGKIHLRSNVRLHLEEGAVLEFSGNPQDYLPAVQSSWEGMECFNYSPLIYAFGCTNVAITGKGTIKARMDTWQKWFSRPRAHMEALKTLYYLASTNAPVEQRQMAVGDNNLRPQFIQFNRCRHVLIEDVKIRNSPFWTIHLLLSEDIVVRRVDIAAHGHNNDGVDPEMVRNVLIEDCRFDQGDDAIAIKAGRNQDAWRLNAPTENLVMRNCTIVEGHQLVAIGSELSGGIRNVYVHDCRFENPEYRLQNVLFIKTNVRRGGFVENIHLENIQAGEARYSVLGIETDVLYQWRDLVPTYEERLTTIRGIHLKNVKVAQTGLEPFRILGDRRAPVKDVFLDQIAVSKAHVGRSRYENAENVRETNIQIGEILAEDKATQQGK